MKNVISLRMAIEQSSANETNAMSNRKVLGNSITLKAGAHGACFVTNVLVSTGLDVEPKCDRSRDAIKTRLRDVVAW